MIFLEEFALFFTIAASFFWALSQVIGKVVLWRAKTLSFNTVRFTVAVFVVVLEFMLFGSIKGISINLPFVSAALSGLLGWFFAESAFFFAMKRDSAYRIIPSGNAYPFWAILFGALLLDESLTWVIPVSAGLVFFGTFFLARQRDSSEKMWRFGIPLASLVALIWGFNAVLSKFSIEGGMSVPAVLLVRLSTATVLFWLAILVRGGGLDLSRREIGLTALSGLVAFPLGTALYFSALKVEGASTLAPLTGTTVLFGFLLSVVFLGESPSKGASLGAVSIFVGILLMFI